MQVVPADAGERVRQTYSDAVARVLALVALFVRQDLDASRASRRRARLLRVQVARLVRELDAAGRAVLRAELARAAPLARQVARAALDAQGLPPPRVWRPVPVRLPGRRPPEQYLSRATRGFEVRAVQAYRRAASASGLSEAQRALDLFADRGVVGLSSTGRPWELASYADTVAVNAFRDAVSVGAVGLFAAATGQSALVRVSGPVPGACDLCAPWEGMVLSLDGGSREYPSVSMAEADGLNHPNCRHLYLPYTDRPFALPTPSGPLHPGVTAPAQRQRVLEAHVRRWGRRAAVALTTEAARRALSRQAGWEDQLARHVREHNLPRRAARET